MTIWFTSDHHFGHERVIEFCGRPFSSCEEMNEAMVERWNAVVKPHDEVYHLGDVAMGKRRETLQYVTRLNGKKYLIPGNHDSCWSGHKKVGPADRALYTGVGFMIMPREMDMKVAGRNMKLCHLPYVGDSHNEERHSEFRPEDKGKWLLCGHVHEVWRVHGHQLNVGVDRHDFTPISEEQIESLLFG